MNTVSLVGKIATEIRTRQLTTAKGAMLKASFLLAVPQPAKDKEPDWVRVETWGKQAENLARFNSKGSRIGVVGRLRSRFYNPDGGTSGGELRSAVVADEIMYLQGRPPAAEPQPEKVARK